MQQPYIIPQMNRPDNTPDVATSARIGGGKRPEGWRSIMSTVLILIAAPVVALLLINFVFQSYEVDGPSMETTLQNGDRLIVNKIPRTWSKITGNSYIPERGDIVIFIKHGVYEFGSGPDKQLIKRVIGVPGDRVVVKDNVITIYNDESPGGFRPDREGEWSEVITSTSGNVDLVVPDDEIFLAGDNRDNSLDSRVFGTVPASDIVGKLAFRIFPINKTESF